MFNSESGYGCAVDMDNGGYGYGKWVWITVLWIRQQVENY